VEEITVLVIEDNELNLKLVRSLLTLGQYQILEAANAEKGIELAREYHPDLILMDVQLPGMDGLTATRIIKKDPDLKEIPVMALTSYAMSGDEGKAIEAGCDGYMTKPIDTRSFLDTISRFIRHNEGVKPRIHRIPPHKSKLLIVDDEPLNIKQLTAYLPDDKYEIIEAYGGEEALKKVATEYPDLIMMDIMMPEINGYEVTKILKNNPVTWSIPIILITSLDSQESKPKGLDEVGADELLNRPVNETELLARINSMLRLKQHREQLKVRTQSMETFPDRVSKEVSPGRERELPTVLLVEDNEKDIRLIQNYLRGEPYNIILARNGEDAIYLVQKKKVDLILLDIILPNINGFEVASRLKEMEETKNIHIVFITAVHDEESKIKGIELGTSDFLTKPLDSRELRIRIRNALKNKALLDELHSHYEATLHSAITDGLTGLYNHAYFMRFLETEIKRSLRQKYPITLIMIDLDNFKRYNDIPGHLAGDHVLRETGQIIKKNIREVDVAARYGGEELAVILPYADKADSMRVAERLREAIGSHAFLEKHPSFGRITASFGIASYPADALTPEELIEKAGLMLDKARKEGENQVCIYENSQ